MSKHLIGLAIGASLGIEDHDLVSLMRENGIEATFTGPGTREKRQEWADLFAKNSILYSSIHAPFKKAADMWTDTLAGEDAEQELMQMVDACTEVDAPILVVHPFIGFFEENIPTPIGLARFCRLAEYAAKKNIRIAIENVEGEEYLDYLLRGLRDYPSIGFCLDTGHELCYNRGRDLLADYGDRLCYMHINSNMGVTSPDGKLTFYDDAHMLPFDGLANMENLAARLKKCDYRGILMMELVRGNRPNRSTNDAYLAMSNEEYIAQAATRIKRLRDMIDG